MDTTATSVVVRRSRRRRPVRCYPDELHIFTLRIFSDSPLPLYATVLVRGRMGQNAAIGPAYDQARLREGEAFCNAIRTVPPPRPPPGLDALCQQWTGFTSFMGLLTATAGYLPSIRLDLTGRKGLVLARAYDRQQARWGDKRRAFVASGLIRPKQGRVGYAARQGAKDIEGGSPLGASSRKLSRKASNERMGASSADFPQRLISSGEQPGVTATC